MLLQTEKERDNQMFVQSVYLSSRDYASPYIQTNLPYKPNGNRCDQGIYDLDNDGVEDNNDVSADDRDKFQEGA